MNFQTSYIQNFIHILSKSSNHKYYLKGRDSCKWLKKVDFFLLQQNEHFEESEGLLYGAGIAD